MATTPSQLQPQRVDKPRLNDWLLVEAVHALEQSRGGETPDHDKANEAARRHGGNLTQRLVVRARQWPVAPRLIEAIHHVRVALGWIIAGSLVLGLFAGAAAARAALVHPPNAPVNVFAALVGLLGVQTFLLIIWALAMILRPRALPTGSLGAAVFAIGRWFLARTHHHSREAQSIYSAAVQAHATVNTHGRIGRWTLSAVSHAIWCAFNIGAIVVLVTLLSTRHYLFAWETTILSEHVFAPMTRALAAGPQWFGLPVPSETQIAASQWTGDPAAPRPPESARRAWSGLLIGALLVYGLVPRMALLLFAWLRRRMLCARYTIDPDQPSVVRLKSELMVDPAHPTITPALASETAASTDHQTRATSRDEPPVVDLSRGQPAIVGVELEQPATTWPPAVQRVTWLDLGFVDTRAERRQVVETLGAHADTLPAVVLVVSLTTTPDRGALNFLAEIEKTVCVPLLVLLTGGQRQRERDRHSTERVINRIEDWRRAIQQIGVHPKHILELDLDHYSPACAQNLAAVLDVNEQNAKPVSHLAEAFECIADHVARHGHTPDLADQAVLHRTIAQLYEHRRIQHWKDHFGSLGSSLNQSTNIKGQMQASAERIATLLPKRLRDSRTWLLSGACTGVLGCLAVGTLATPVAFASLPMWSAIGAAFGALMQSYRTQFTDETPGAASPQFDETVQSAALFAMLLELQGRSETAITQVLDRAIPDEHEPAQLHTSEAVRAWLNTVKQRFETAVTEVDAS